MRGKLLKNLIPIVLIGCSSEATKVENPDAYWDLRIEQTARGYFEVCKVCPVATPKTQYQIAFSGNLGELGGVASLNSDSAKAIGRNSAKDARKPVVVKNKSIVLTVRFPFDTDKVQKNELNKIKKFVQSEWPEYEEKVLLVKGYTDAVGDKKYNDDLAMRRAVNVRKVLVKMGADDVRVEANGKCCYLASNSMKYGREINRRAEVEIIHNDGELTK